MTCTDHYEPPLVHDVGVRSQDCSTRSLVCPRRELTTECPLVWQIVSHRAEVIAQASRFQGSGVSASERSQAVLRPLIARLRSSIVASSAPSSTPICVQTGPTSDLLAPG